MMTATKKGKQRKPARQVARHRHSPADGDFLTDSADAPKPGGGAPAAQGSLGERIRAARQLRGLTIEDLSSRSGVSLDELKRVESNRTNPPLGQLVRLGKALDMKMAYFLSAGEDKPTCVVCCDRRPTVDCHGKRHSERYGYVYQSLACEKADRLMDPFLVSLTPTDFGELSTHDGQEFLFVLEGEIRVQVDNQVERLRPGDSIYYDSNRPHLVKCHGDKPAKILAVIHAGTK